MPSLECYYFYYPCAQLRNGSYANGINIKMSSSQSCVLIGEMQLENTGIFAVFLLWQANIADSDVLLQHPVNVYPISI